MDQEAQKKWHDEWYRMHGTATRNDGDRPQDKFYAVTSSAHQHFRRLVYKDCAGKQILDYCCGTGHDSINLALAGANVTGVDISPVGIELAQGLAQEAGAAERTTFVVAPGEHTGLPDDTFDVVFGLGSLHHLNLREAYPEICRIMKPNGCAVFSEPLAYNPVFNLYRRITATARTEDEHRFTRADFQMAKEFFGKSSLTCYSLTALAAVPFRNRPIFKPLLDTLEVVDRWLFAIPGAKWLAWFCVFSLENPVKSNVPGVGDAVAMAHATPTPVTGDSRAL